MSIVAGMPMTGMPSSLSSFAPVKEPSPPMTTIASSLNTRAMDAAFSRPSGVRNSGQRDVCSTVPPWLRISETERSVISSI